MEVNITHPIKAGCLSKKDHKRDGSSNKRDSSNKNEYVEVDLWHDSAN